MKIFIDDWGLMPERAHSTDAGLDIKTSNYITVKKGGDVIFNSGIHVSIPAGYMGMIATKSGLNVKHGIQCTGVVDSGFSGQIIFKLYNLGHEDYTFEPGDKVAQLLIVPVLTPDLEVVSLEKLEDDCWVNSDRGASGFGSTGK